TRPRVDAGRNVPPDSTSLATACRSVTSLGRTHLYPETSARIPLAFTDVVPSGTAVVTESPTVPAARRKRPLSTRESDLAGGPLRGHADHPLGPSQGHLAW